MTHQPRLFDRRRLLLLVSFLLFAGFFATTLFGYYVSKQAIRDAIIDQDLPLTSSNIYSEIQKDLVRPVLIASTMASDTFLRDWVLQGEQNVSEMARYLDEIKKRYGAFSSFFVSEKSGIYYTSAGVLKRVAQVEPRDAWYYRVRAMQEDYEINVDPDLANQDALTIFINYRVHDFSGNYIGVTGVGLTVDAVRHLIGEYQQRFKRTIYFVDGQGKVVIFGNRVDRDPNLRAAAGLGELVERILKDKSGSYQYQANGDNHILNVNYLPELKWYLFVEQNEEPALAEIRQTLYVNLGISLVVTLVVLFLTHLALSRYQKRMEELAATDKLTGLLNRQAFTIFFDKLVAEYRREPRPTSALLVDLDHFKEINDSHGHLSGDRVLQGVAQLLQDGLRESDIAVRWGGEEFLLVLRACDLAEARRIAEKLRQDIDEHVFAVADKKIRVTISIGVAEYDGSELPDQWINRADRGLYSAKNGGRNRVGVVLFPD
ncbi:MAG: sensor domain-containing diguanylate cyclase [Gammaproteobacteria bacterium]|nr:GGDEF domain-containing protein [Rhodocyclaceae bacterium]MBU3907641.1 sensor domain-containing diguanylate cyclase [Gammaproteobacteria bacterium]MBU3990871.1 sensor domain-containing diguanylate cyclase [Gammaproteobacteria bacterium]MBU4004287.1 sensor domain-containing diguanylate cyclase [Gammaproteobacteria bacterium]MBU4019696.1 sensor domain-containing diguanylate cyclase [Gammaproteobacteria bacterium]